MGVPTYAYAANNPLKYVDRKGLYYTVDSWDPEDKAASDYAWKEIGRAAMDPIIGPKVLEMWASPKEFKIHVQRSASGESSTDSSTNEIDFRYTRNPHRTPEDFPSYNRSTLWHEMGHQWAIAHGASDWEIKREGVLWENRGRMSKGIPDDTPWPGPSRLRRIHWQDTPKGGLEGIYVFP